MDHNEETRRQELLEILQDPTPIWKDEDHPELADGAGAWVRQIRAGSKERSDRWESPAE